MRRGAREEVKEEGLEGLRREESPAGRSVN